MDLNSALSERFHDMAQTATTQIGPNAIAPPAIAPNDPEVPDSLATETDELSKHTSETQIGPYAIAPPSGATAEDEGDLVFYDLPPFPDDVPTAPLLRLSLKKLLDGESEEIERMWRACCDTGFFYLDLRDAVIPQNKRDSATDLPGATMDSKGRINGEALLRDVDALYELGDKMFAYSPEELQKYDFFDQGSYFGYKGLGVGVVNAKGTRDSNEFYNVSKDDILGQGERLPAPDLLQVEANRELLKSYILRSHAIVILLLSILNEKLGLPPETLQSLHRLCGISGDQVRWLRMPPQSWDESKMTLAEHTDFGSITILFNRLGGLQILPPDSDQWCYVKPLRGHALCNLGDAMVKFTCGILRSNIHRIVIPPGAQADETRKSLVYFARPEDEVVLQELEGSSMIDEKRKTVVQFAGSERITAKEWTLRRAMGKRAGGDYANSHGTEGDRLAKA